MRDVASLFKDRHTAGEFLFFAGQFSLGTVVVGLTPGAVDVGFATAFLTGGDLRYVPAARFDRGDSVTGFDIRGREVALADDGLTPLPHLLSAIRAIEGFEPVRAVLLTPWVPAGFSENLGPSSRLEIFTLHEPHLLPRLPFYEPGDVPTGDRVAWCLQAVAGAGYDPAVASLVRTHNASRRERAQPAR